MLKNLKRDFEEDPLNVLISLSVVILLSLASILIAVIAIERMIELCQ